MGRRLSALAIVAALVAMSGCAAQLPGVQAVRLPAGCELWLYAPGSHVGERAAALSCPGVDLIRLYPLPMIQGWDEAPTQPPTPAPTPTPPARWQTT